jgi:diguanylate cyclase (GGDEF)-like protein
VVEPITSLRPAPPPARELSADVVRASLRYVERVLGRTAMEAVADAAGFDDIDALLGDPLRWFTHDEVLAVADAGAAICHEPNFGRRTGEEIIAATMRNGTAAFLRRAGSMKDVLPQLVNAGNRMAATRILRLVEADESRGVIEGRWLDPSSAHPFYCGVAAGSYAAVPTLFGAIGSVVETSCQSRGDDVCRFHLSWVTDAAPSDAGDVAAIVGTTAVGNADVLLGRFEQLQEVASKLARAEDVPTVLQLITQLVGVAVAAPRYLLAVRTSPGADLLVCQQGWTQDALAEEVALRLESGDVHENELVVPVESDDNRYGVLAAVFSEAYSATQVDRRLLSAYARHAAAALKAAAALESARRDRDTANALLILARALSEVTTRPAVVGALVDVVPTVIGCSTVWVWLWDEEHEELCLEAMSEPDRTDLPERLTVQDEPGIAELMRFRQPMLLNVGSEHGPVLEHMTATGSRWCSVVPILARGDFLGVIVAGFADTLVDADHDPIVAGMQGLAGQAAAALDNARLLDRIKDQALRDPLTGLPNRPLMEDRADQALRIAGRTGDHVGLLFVDLDRFKIVNDTLGHAAGDRLICIVADRIATCLRGSDTLARLGGDEFVVLLPEIHDVGDATAAANRIVEALREPLELDGRSLFVSCSVGIAVSPHHGSTYSELLQHADAAMYEAKAQGRNQFEIRAARPTTGRSQLDLETDLHRAAERDELVVLYQPQIDFQTMRIVSVEALLRWDHHELGRLGPDAFLPMAEDSGLIVELDRWVRDRAADQAVRWRDAGTPLRVAVNVSTRDLRRPTLQGEVADLLATKGLAPHLLELEITDRVVMSEEALPAILHGFHELGVRLAIDDFGTGTSVLGRLQRCPVDVLKIDKGFVQTITAANPDAPVVSALMTLARRLGMEVVAEGVETAFQGGLLRRLGCHLAQGYFFSPPVAAEDIDSMLVSPMATRTV